MRVSTKKDLKELLRAGRAVIPATMILSDAKLINVITKEIYLADVAIYKDTIVAVGDVKDYKGKDTKVISLKGKYLCPGLIDGHIHSECSKMSLTSYAKTVVPRGTTSMISGLDEYLVTTGLEGLNEVLEEMKKLPLRVFWGIPFKTPYTLPESTIGFKVTEEVHKKVQDWEDCFGVWETVKEFLQEEDEDTLGAIVEARKRRLPIFGSAPMTQGKDLNSYICAGVRMDHESYSSEEVAEKIRKGMHAIIRESTITEFLDENIRALTEINSNFSRRMSFCTDDVKATDIIKYGHLDYVIKKAIKAGVDPVTAIQMATLNCAEAYRIDDMVGSITPGKIADILVLDSPGSFNIEQVFAKGIKVAENNKMCVNIKPPKRSNYLTKSIKRKPLKKEDFEIKVSKDTKKVKALSMKVHGPFVRKRHDVELDVVNGVVQPSVKKDVLQASVIERYGKNNNKSLAFVTGWELKEGAMASSAAPDDNNIVVLGTNSEDMAIAANYLIEKNGGQVVVRNKKVVKFLPLEIGGIVTDLEPEEISKIEEEIDMVLREMGSKLPDPMMYMFFLPITAIPDYALTDGGPVYYVNLEYFNPILEEIK